MEADERQANELPLAEMVGERVRAMRRVRGWTLEQLAREAGKLGYQWTTARVVDVEKGKRAMTLGLLVALACILRCRLTDLIGEQASRVRMSREYAIDSNALRKLLQGQSGEAIAIDDLSSIWAENVPRQIENALTGGSHQWHDLNRIAGRELSLEEAVRLESTSTSELAGRRAGKALGWSPSQIAAASDRLWGQTLSAERDSRAGEGVSAQKKGRITRDMLNELQQLKAELGNGDD